MDLTSKIGRRLREARDAQGLSLAGLSARTSGLSKSRIGNYENGIRRPGLEEAQALAAALGTVSAAYLLCLDDEEFLSEEERALLRLFRRADRRGKATILDVVRIVAGEDEERTRDEDRSVGKSPQQRAPGASEISPTLTRRSPEETEHRVQERFPHYRLDYATYEKRSLPSGWHCTKHGVDFATAGSSLLHPTAVGCPACREEQSRVRFRTRFADPFLERHLAVLAALGDERNVTIHRRRAAGARVSEIAAELGMNEGTVDKRLQEIRRILAEADRVESTQAQAAEGP